MVKLQDKFAAATRGTFVGIPTDSYETGGKEQLGYLLRAGLMPDSKVIDLGCGVLRAGYWLIHLLDTGCYCGIEPHAERLHIGADKILEPEIRELKKPRFDSNSRFDTAVFAEKFDFFLAYSIWTHASKAQIEVMLEGFLRDSSNDGVFLTTFLPVNWRNRDYKGVSWFGTSHESLTPGCIHHSFEWIRAQCEEHRGLSVTRLGRDQTHGQEWLDIRRRSSIAG